MACNLSDEEFCETNFAEPSPVKKRKDLLPDPKEWKMKLEKRAEFKTKMQQAETEFLTFLESKLTKKDNKLDLLLKSAELDEFNIIKAVDPSNEIKLFPDGRRFFDDEPLQKNKLEPSNWFHDSSIYSSLSLEDFLKLVRQGFLLTRGKSSKEEAGLLRLYCLEILKVEHDALTASSLLQYLSSQPFVFDTISLKSWNSPSFSRLLEILEKSVLGYSPKECQKLFREVCLAALDQRMFSYTHVFPPFLASCIQVSSSEFLVQEEIDWLIQLKLEPEEYFHILKILPQNGDFKDFCLQFASRALCEFVESTNNGKCLSLRDLDLLLKTQKALIRSFSMNKEFHFLNILNYVVLRLLIPPEDETVLEEIMYFIEGLKHYHQQEKGVAYFVLSECINRICLTMQQRIPLHRKRPVDIQCRTKLFMQQS